jgi:transcription elongation factor Elf1
MASGNNNVKCPKCGKETQSLVSTVNGNQYVVCPGCSALLKVEVKQGQFTGKVQL